MKKSTLWSLLLAISILLTFTACSANGSETTSTECSTEAPTEKSTENLTEAPTEAPTEVPTETPTEASTEAPTEAPTEASTEAPTEVPTETPTEAPTEAPHTEHIGADACEVCGIVYFDELKTYIMENGTQESGNYFYEVFIEDSTTYEIAYFGESDKIEIRTPFDLQNRNCWIEVTRSNVKYGEYRWVCYVSSSSVLLNKGKIEGVLEANKISPDTSIILEYSSSTFKSDSDSGKSLQYSQRVIREIINEVLIPTIKKCENNLSPSDFGFERFE